MKRHKHRLSHYRLFTGEMGYLIPISCVEVLPGDTFEHATSLLLRASPMLAPVMHPVVVRVHHFYVPNRLIWSSWENFITGGPDGNDASVPPTIATNGNATTQALLDQLGVPVVSGVNVSALPVRAYNKVFNEFFRDEDLVTARTEDDTTLAQIAWEKDYLTSARPWAQKGTAVTLPLGTRANVRGIGKVLQTYGGGAQNVYETGGTGSVAYGANDNADIAAESFRIQEDPNNAGFPNVYADLSTATAASVNSIRRAFALSRFQEARALYGSRYTEYLRYLGVSSSDSRLQRPEYLGGGKQTIAFSEILQTAAAGTDPVGTMRGHGIAAIRTRKYRKYFEEHGFVLTLFSCRPKTVYMDSLPKKFIKTTREDYFQKELENIGQVEIKVNEVYMNVATGANTWGYGDRYRDQREELSLITGQFRNSTLNHWHMARDFSSAPTLNSSFINCDATGRIFADQTAGAHRLWCMANHQLIARRIVGRGGPGRII